MSDNHDIHAGVCVSVQAECGASYGQEHAAHVPGQFRGLEYKMVPSPVTSHSMFSHGPCSGTVMRYAEFAFAHPATSRRSCYMTLVAVS